MVAVMSIVIRSWRQISSSRSIRKDLNGELWVNHYPMNNCKTMGTNVRAMRKMNLLAQPDCEWLLSQTNILSCEAQKNEMMFLWKIHRGWVVQSRPQFSLVWASKFQPSVKVDHIWVFIHDCFWLALPSGTGCQNGSGQRDVNIKDEREVACGAEGLYSCITRN